jgi:hypothetical protein
MLISHKSGFAGSFFSRSMPNFFRRSNTPFTKLTRATRTKSQSRAKLKGGCSLPSVGSRPRYSSEVLSPAYEVNHLAPFDERLHMGGKIIVRGHKACSPPLMLARSMARAQETRKTDSLGSAGQLRQESIPAVWFPPVQQVDQRGLGAHNLRARCPHPKPWSLLVNQCERQFNAFMPSSGGVSTPWVNCGQKGACSAGRPVP